ncbi:hypothetical protein AXF24_12825 [Streptococcus pneumoniae]|nr:hypothetical protein AWW74_12840 [Streptococcus pneumoniae]KXB94549.1 hypothetical protein AXF24_12825 [Streptococcus pneumoniae]
MPVGAFGGRADIMEQIAPLGPVYQAGTLSGNPAAVAAGQVTLKLLAAPGFYENLSAQTHKLAQGLGERAKAAGVPLATDSIGGMFGLYFTDQIPTAFEQVQRCDVEKFKNFFHGMLIRGIYFAPSGCTCIGGKATYCRGSLPACVLLPPANYALRQYYPQPQRGNRRTRDASAAQYDRRNLCSDY